MADENESSSATVVLVFLTGAAIGAIAALVLAPQSGEATQRQVRGFAKKAGKGLRNATGKAEGVWGDVIEQGREFLKDKQPILAEAFEAGRKAINRERDRARGRKRK
ncbi:MAG TPA: YtxH domain-containing protein [Nitrospiraceae bacterium]|nr:YtxH domain-containing protein [Nitrospiraceae bacterium]